MTNEDRAAAQAQKGFTDMAIDYLRSLHGLGKLANSNVRSGKIDVRFHESVSASWAHDEIIALRVGLIQLLHEIDVDQKTARKLVKNLLHESQARQHGKKKFFK